MLNFFIDCWGKTDTKEFQKARKNFVESMAAYSLISYFLQIKDRHNGNILLDDKGRITHIDYGFMLSNSPGKNINFESSPFKLTLEFMEVMGPEFSYFKMLLLMVFRNTKAC